VARSTRMKITNMVQKSLRNMDWHLLAANLEIGVASPPKTGILAAY
jgi:hypothetical protein